MIPRHTKVTTQDGQVHLFLESWSPDGLAGFPRRVRRIRWTFLNLRTRETWTTYDHRVFTVVPDRVGA